MDIISINIQNETDGNIIRLLTYINNKSFHMYFNINRIDLIKNSYKYIIIDEETKYVNFSADDYIKYSDKFYYFETENYMSTEMLDITSYLKRKFNDILKENLVKVVNNDFFKEYTW